MNMDGHKIKNGCKIMASSIYPFFQHKFEPKHIHLPNNHGIKLNVSPEEVLIFKGIPLDHFRSFCEYALQTKMWMADSHAARTMEQFWMETQGNFAHT
jgi:small subunit ribosomal protein S29